MNRRLALYSLAPLVTYTGIASLPLDRELNYTVRIVVVAALMAWAWRHYVPLRGPRSPLVSVLVGVAAGAVGLVLWVGLMNPFVEAGQPWGETAFWLRFAAAGLLVPLFEEQVMRGFVLRFAYQWGQARKAGAADPFGAACDGSVLEVPAGAWSWFAVLVSTAAFTLGHHHTEYAAAFAYGLLMAGLWIWRKDLLSCVVAHAVTNIVLALHVRQTGAWELW